MLEVAISLILHCVLSFVFNYCYDEEKIWNDEIEPKLWMPKLHDLEKKSDVYVYQRYVEKVIIPSYDYFSAVSEVKNFQNKDAFSPIVAWLSTLFFTANAFRKADIFPYMWLNAVIGIIAYVLIAIIVSMIYNKTKLKLGTFGTSLADIKKEYYRITDSCGREFDLSEENALNNFIIETHYRYIRYIHYSIEKRYRVKKVVEVIAGGIYILFIARMPT